MTEIQHVLIVQNQVLSHWSLKILPECSKRIPSLKKGPVEFQERFAVMGQEKREIVLQKESVSPGSFGSRRLPVVPEEQGANLVQSR